MDSKKIFEKIFGCSPGSSNAKTKLLEAEKNYPYFIAPYFFSTKFFSGEKEEITTSLFLHSPVALYYALKENETNTEFPFAASHTAETEPYVNPFSPEKINQETETGRKEQETITTEKTPTDNAPLTEKIQEAAPVQKQGEQHEEDLIFEPLYTTDYFASQGIKLSEEVNAGDRLGNQLRSFTEWLKTMKRIPGKSGNQAMELNTPFDKKVEIMAEKSNLEQDVITESMAEACITQGKTRKAIEIYEKLSLLNPAKSAYFAAKIAGLLPGADLA